MAGPPGAQAPPPGQGAPPPGYQYPPQGYQQPPQSYAGSAPPQAWNPGPAPMAAPRPMNWDMITFVLRLLGFFLAALGAIVLIALVEPSGSCFTSGATCFTNGTSVGSYPQNAANGLLYGKMLFALGALLIGMGSGIKLHWSLRAPAADAPANQMAWVLTERVINYGIIAGTVVLFWLLLASTTPITSLTGL